jgi:hypothetical protein
MPTSRYVTLLFTSLYEIITTWSWSSKLRRANAPTGPPSFQSRARKPPALPEAWSQLQQITINHNKTINEMDQFKIILIFDFVKFMKPVTCPAISWRSTTVTSTWRTKQTICTLCYSQFIYVLHWIQIQI